MMTSQIVGGLVSRYDTDDMIPYPKPTALLVDPQVYRMEENSHISIPSQILLKIWENDENVYCILNVNMTSRPDFPKFTLYTLELVENPLAILQNKVLYDDGIPYYSQSYAYLRPATETYVETVMIMTMNRSKYYLEMDDKSRMYEFTIAHSAKILGPQFQDIRKGKDTAQRYHFVAGKDRACFRRPKPIRPPSKNTIPMHVFRVFVEKAIEKKEECPIMMECFKETTISSTPCGHLFSYDAIVKALQSSGKCPTCRLAVKVEELQYLA